MANEVWAGSRLSTSTSISAAAKIWPWLWQKGWGKRGGGQQNPPASSCFGTVATNCSKKNPHSWFCAPDLWLSLCQCFQSQDLLWLPQTGKPKEPSGWNWCCVLEHSHSGVSLELGCFQPALLCQVLLIQEHVVGVFPLGRRSTAAFSLLSLVASLGVGSLCSLCCSASKESFQFP